MIDAGLCRKLINRRIDRVKRVFKWAASKELVPAAAYQALRTLAGLRAGRTEARESKPVRPVDPAHVAATLPFLNRHLRAMVELQRLTGMRPGEACGLTFGEVDRSGELWLYRPTQHKTRHHGKDRVIPLGPRARAVLIAFLVGDHPPPRGFEQIDLRDNTARLVAADAYQEAGRERDALLLRDLARPVVSVAGCVVDPAAPVFSPREAREERFRAMRAGRKTKVQPSQRNRRADNPKRSPKDRFSDVGYAHAVGDAAARAGVPHWHPNQLRHLVGTEVREGHGLEAAQVLLGHSHAKATEVYAERNLKLAAAVAAKIG
jgi:integrase